MANQIERVISEPCMPCAVMVLPANKFLDNARENIKALKERSTRPKRWVITRQPEGSQAGGGKDRKRIRRI